MASVEAPLSAQALKELTGGKPIKSKNQLRRLKQKQKKAVVETPEEKVCCIVTGISRSHCFRSMHCGACFGWGLELYVRIVVS
jgi:hypothetical protein